MGFWIFYFLTKVYLYFKGTIRLDTGLNLLFLLFVILPMPKNFKYLRHLKAAKSILNIIIGILLLWRDSWLPSPVAAFNLLKQHGMPSNEYIYNFLLRYYNPKEIAILIFILVLCIIVSRFKKTMAAVTALLLILPLFLSQTGFKHQSAQKAEKYLESFFSSELTKVIRFKPPADEDFDFDIVIIHVCSLSWDDMEEFNLQGHPFFKQFDYLFTDFNTVTSYSNPAAIRILNANCGQKRHKDLYNNMLKECSLMESLSNQGYEINFARNHNGKYGKFDEEIKRYGNLDIAALPLDNLSADKYMFDDSPVYSDYDVLAKWWAARQGSASKRTALYYNTVSLHDGSHWTKDIGWWKKDPKEVYREFIPSLFQDLTKFFSLVEGSGRNVVILFVPEHGRAVKGSGVETAGLRDIPLPRITTVPVGIKLLGRSTEDTETRRKITVSKSTSYLALSHILSAFVEKSPFKLDIYTSRRFIDSIPQTEFVSENEGNLILKIDNDYYLYGKEKKWIQLTERELK